MKVLVTGGAGFIGRWLVKELLNKGLSVVVLDNLANGSEENITEFKDNPKFELFVKGNVGDKKLVVELFKNHNFDVCFHLAASINVQDSIDNPEDTFLNDTIYTFNLLEICKESNVKFVFMSTCMVYEKSNDLNGITEESQIKPASPYAGAKLAAENMVLSYYYAYGLPTVVLRPFNTYGPYQKSSHEGGVVSIFLEKKIAGEKLKIYGDGTQTRDLLYVEDCANFVMRAGLSDSTNGMILHAGLGKDISINELAQVILPDPSRQEHVPHIHQQSEIAKLLCNNRKAKEVLGWSPVTDLEEGIKKTEKWLRLKQSFLKGEKNG